MKLSFSKLWILFLAIILAAAWTVFVWSGSLQLRSPGFRGLGLMAAFFSLVMALSLGLARWAGGFFRQLPTRQRSALLLVSLSLALLLLVMIPVPLNQYFYGWLPDHELVISAAGLETGEVTLVRFDTAVGELNPEQVFKSIDGKLVWRGKVGEKAVLTFNPTTESRLVEITWDGSSQTIDLAAPFKRQVPYLSQSFPIPWFHGFYLGLCAWLALASLVFLFLLASTALRFRPVASRLAWPWYALPMFSAWLVYLLTFWPGLMSPDSIMQWGEVLSQHWSDAHPAIHTLFIWLLTRLWLTPAILVLFHIILLSGLVAWGFGELQKRGVAPLWLWLGALLFALFPLNGLLVISVWKDITYACALFALFLQFLKIYFLGRAWLDNNWNLAGLVLAAMAASLARHNGFPVVMASLLALFCLEPRAWRRVLLVLALVAGLWLGIRGPLYTALQVKMYPGFTNILFLDHIDAHLQAGTPLQPDEKAFLEGLLPLDQWPYNCADSDIRKMDGPIPFDYFAQETSEPARIAWNLFLRDPRVDWEHTLCAGGLDWKINTGHYVSVITLGQLPSGAFAWVVENDLGVKEHSYLPALLPLLANQYSEKDLIAKPAFYLLLALFVLLGLALRWRSPRLIWVAAPLVCQTGVMFFVTYAQDFRYFYANLLIGFFCLVLFFLPKPVDVG